MNPTQVDPAFDRTAFTCPRCHQLADQTWCNAYASPVHNAQGVPLRIQGADLQRLGENPQFPPQVRRQKLEYWNRINAGEVFLDRWAPVQSDLLVAGMELSVCHACKGIAVWLGGRMIYPAEKNQE